MGLRKYNVKIERQPEAKLKFRIHAPKPGIELPKMVDLRSKMPPVYNQGHLGSCTANAICGAFQYLIPSFMGSRLFLYYNERKLERAIPDDSGASLADGILCMQKYGVCPETMWPYKINNFAIAPPQQCYMDARRFKADEVQNIHQDMTSMRTSLANGFPFVVGFMVYNSFESNSVARTGMVPMPTPADQPLGGHAVLVCGYDDARQVWIVRNSWGASWGDKGYFYLPYNYLTNPTLSSDLWNISSSNTAIERKIRKPMWRNQFFHKRSTGR